MKNLSTCALVLALVTLPAAAFAQPSVKISDIDFQTADGMALFKLRADNAARMACQDVPSLLAAQACRKAVKQDLTAKATEVREARLRAAPTLATR